MPLAAHLVLGNTHPGGRAPPLTAIVAPATTQHAHGAVLCLGHDARSPACRAPLQQHCTLPQLQQAEGTHSLANTCRARGRPTSEGLLNKSSPDEAAAGSRENGWPYPLHVSTSAHSSVFMSGSRKKMAGRPDMLRVYGTPAASSFSARGAMLSTPRQKWRSRPP